MFGSASNHGKKFLKSKNLSKASFSGINHGVPFVIKTIRITSKVRLHCNKTRSFRLITILITNQTKPPIDLTCFDCLRESRLPSTLWRKSNSAEFDRFETHWNGMPADEIERKRNHDTSQRLFRCSIDDDYQNNRNFKSRLFDGEWNALNHWASWMVDRQDLLIRFLRHSVSCQKMLSWRKTFWSFLFSGKCPCKNRLVPLLSLRNPPDRKYFSVYCTSCPKISFTR